MNEIWNKISSYDLFNNLFPGTLFVVIADKLLGIPLIQENIIIAIFLYYFVGMIISRVGSLIIEPILKFFGLIKFAPYKEYIEACKKDDKIELLSQVNNTYRTIISLFILLISLKFYLFIESLWSPLRDLRTYILIIIVIILFVISYKKQTKFIVKRIKKSTK